MAYVLSSISGNLISAASAGFAPTNGADVSAIASAYQVVSATATQLNAGTAYVTSINETPISATRAGNAANASLANSAWYDGTGRLISSLPDEATVSSIASAYAESAASSKQDTLSFSYDDDKISAINGSALAGQGGGGGLVTAIGTSESGITSINNSGLVDTAALRSDDYSSLYVQEPLYISASGDSSYIGISGGAGGIDSATCSAIASAYAESAASGKLDTTAQVVTSVGTETAYTPDGVSDVVTSINGNYISAHSADSAFMAEYDDRGRLLTSLASEYEASSIASAYAESAASSKLDSSASSSFYTTANESGFITGLPIDISVRDLSASRRVRATATGEDLYGNFDYAGMYFRSGSNRPYNIGIDNTGANFYIATAKNGFERIYASSIQSWNEKLDGSASSSFYTTANESGFVDSAYVDSAVSSKADSSSLSSYALSSDVSGVIDTVSSNSASWAGGITGDYLTSKVGSGRATFTTAFQDGLDKRPALCINGERGVDTAVYPRMLITDWNRSTGDTHSGSLLANAFEFYTCPTSARGEVDPSGVLLARLDDNKVEFYFDSSVTSKNRSAQYGRGGILLGVSGASGYSIQIVNSEYGAPYIVLDDHSGVTGRIDPSSMNYWNGKLDESATADFYSTSNPSAFIDSAYVYSAVSSKQDTLTFAYNEDSAISAINGSALAGGGAVTGDYVENSALDSVTAYSATGGVSSMATGISSISGQPLIPTYLANPTYQYGGQSTFVYMPASSIWTTADAATGVFSPLQYATGACLAMNAGHFKAYYKGNEWFVTDDRYGYARGEVHNSRGCRVIVEHTAGSWAALSAKNSDANVTLNNGKFYGTAKMAVANSQAYVQVQRGNSASKYNSAKLDTDYLKFYNGMTTGYLDPEDTASGTAYMPAETEYMYISSIPYWNAKMDSTAIQSAYASASATQATANGVLYILLPDGA